MSGDLESNTLPPQNATVGGAILRVWPQPDGVRAVFEDESHSLFLFSALDDSAAPLPGLEAGAAAAESVIWDCLDPRVFAVCAGVSLHAFLITPPLGAPGAAPALLARAPLPATHAPVVLANGAVTCRLRGGALDTIILDSHRALQGAAPGAAGGGGGGGFEIVGGPSLVMGSGGGGASAAKGLLAKR